MNDLDICLEVVSRSCQPLRYIRRWISWKPLQIESWFQRTTNRKWHMDYQMITLPMTSHDPQRCCEAVRPAIQRQLGFLLAVKHYASKQTSVKTSAVPRFDSPPFLNVH